MIGSEKIAIEDQSIGVKYDEKTKKLLLQIGKKGAENAAQALSEMVSKEIGIEVPSLHFISPIDIPKILKSHGLQTVVIIEQLSHNLECDLILVFTLEEAKKLVDLILETVAMEGIEDYMVLEELGNILLGNFINALSDLTNTILKPSPPAHIVDYFDAILDNYVTRLLFDDKNATLFDTHLTCAGTDIKGMILMFLDDDFQNKISDEFDK